METEYDYLFKIVLIGDAGVGKTSIVRRYTDGVFTSAGIPTIGVDFCIKTLQIGSSAVKVRIPLSLSTSPLFFSLSFSLSLPVSSYPSLLFSLTSCPLNKHTLIWCHWCWSVTELTNIPDMLELLGH